MRNPVYGALLGAAFLVYLLGWEIPSQGHVTQLDGFGLFFGGFLLIGGVAETLRRRNR
jgi:hypothetical protein